MGVEAKAPAPAAPAKPGRSSAAAGMPAHAGQLTRERRSSTAAIVHELTVGSGQLDDTAMYGLTPKGTVRPTSLAAEIAQMSKKDRFWHVIKKVPFHLAHEVTFSFLPLLAGIIPMVIGGWLARELQDNFPNVTDSYTLNGYEEMETTQHNGTVKALMWLKSITIPIGLYIFPTAYLCTLWSWRVLLKPVLLPFFLPGFLIDLGMTCANVALNYNGNHVLEDKMFYVHIAVVVIFLLPAFVRAGRVIKNPLLGWLWVPIWIGVVGVMAAYQTFFPLILNGDDYVKFIFAAFINPPITTVLIIICRFVARTHRHNHPLTSCMTVAFPMMVKKLYGRYVVNTMKSSAFVFAVAIWLGLLEIVVTLSLKITDRRIYKNLLGPIAKMFMGTELDLTAQMTNPRNRTLRVNNAVLETSLEIVFIWITVFALLWYDVSSDGVRKPWSASIINGFIQFATELVVDFFIICALTIFQNEPYMEFERARFQGWSLSVAFITFFASGYYVTNTLTRVLCHVPGMETRWVYTVDSCIM